MPFHQLAVIDPAAFDDLVLQYPRRTCLGIFLNTTRHVRVTSAAYRDVDRWQILSRVGQPETEPQVFDHRLGLLRCFDLERIFTPPPVVAVLFDLFRQSAHRTKVKRSKEKVKGKK